MIKFKLVHPQATHQMLGYIPHFLSEHSPDDAVTQIDRAYVGGWLDFKNFRMNKDHELVYPGDPPMVVLAEYRLRDEVIRVHDAAWVSVTQPDGSFRAARLD